MAPKESNKMTLLALTTVVLMTWQVARAQTGGCTSALMSLSPCFSSATKNATKPSSSCCSKLTEMLQTQPECLCSMISGGGAMAGFAIDQTIALALPAACNVQNPPVSQCNDATGPTNSASNPASTTAPVGSSSSDATSSVNSSNGTPEGDTTTPTTPSQTNIPSTTGSGYEKFPTIFGASSGATIMTSSPRYVTILLLLVVSFALSASSF